MKEVILKKVIYTKDRSKKSSPTKTSSPKKIATNKIYYILWRDAFSEPDEWLDDSSIDDQDYLVETIGYLIDTPKKNYYTIAASITQDNNFCSVINIPKNMIIRKTLIKI